MIKSRTHPTWKKKEPWRFVPRRDLFPDAEAPSNESPKSKNQRKEPERKYNTPVHQIQNKTIIPTTQQNMENPKKTRRPPLPEYRPLTPVKMDRTKKGAPFAVQPDLLFLLFAGLFILGSKWKGLEILNQPQSIQMLKSIGPYLNEKEQGVVYTAAGVMEAMHLIKDVMNQSYHNQNRATLMHVPSNPAKRKIEAMKAVKPYIHPDSRRQLDRVLNFYESANKVQRNIAIYQNNRTLSGDQRISPIQSAGEFLKVIRPVLPQEQKDKADKAVQVMKMIEAMGAAEKLTRNEKTGRIKNQSEQKEQETQADQEKKNNQKDQMQTIMDSFAPMLNDEQKESMDMIMKMAQLLSQPEQTDGAGSEGKE